MWNLNFLRAFVSFGPRNRAIGAAAKSQVRQLLFIYLFILTIWKTWQLCSVSSFNRLPRYFINVLFFCMKVVTNCKNTVQGFKRFHGRAFTDPYVQSAKSNLVYDLAQMPSGTTGIKVNEHFVVICLNAFNVLKGFLTFPFLVFRSCTWRKRRCSVLSRSPLCFWPNWRRQLRLRSRSQWQTASFL